MLGLKVRNGPGSLLLTSFVAVPEGTSVQDLVTTRATLDGSPGTRGDLHLNRATFEAEPNPRLEHPTRPWRKCMLSKTWRCSLKTNGGLFLSAARRPRQCSRPGSSRRPQTRGRMRHIDGEGLLRKVNPPFFRPRTSDASTRGDGSAPSSSCAVPKKLTFAAVIGSLNKCLCEGVPCLRGSAMRSTVRRNIVPQSVEE